MKPNPGSKEALDSGCKCPVIDNEFGRGCGMTGSDGEPLFWVSELCPIHGTAVVPPAAGSLTEEMNGTPPEKEK